MNCNLNTINCNTLQYIEINCNSVVINCNSVVINCNSVAITRLALSIATSANGETNFSLAKQF